MPPIPNCCVACGRPAATGQNICPYCDEAVYETRKRRIARCFCFILLTAGTPLFAWLRGCQISLLWPTPLTILDGILMALGIGLLLIPNHQTGIAPAARIDRLWQVWRPLGGTLLLAITTALFILAAWQGTRWTPVGIVLAATIPAALVSLPSLAQLPWRGVASGILLGATWHGLVFCLA